MNATAESKHHRSEAVWKWIAGLLAVVVIGGVSHAIGYAQADDRLRLMENAIASMKETIIHIEEQASFQAERQARDKTELREALARIERAIERLNGMGG